MRSENVRDLTENITVKLAVPQTQSHRPDHCEIKLLNFRFQNKFGSVEDRIHIILDQLCNTMSTHWLGLSPEHAQQFESLLTRAGWCAVHTTGVYQHLLWLVENCESGFAWVDTLVKNDRSVWFQDDTEAAFFKIHISQ